MRKILGILVALLGVAGCSEIQPVKSQPKLEAIEWSDIWIEKADSCNLPRVLLVGDSITRGYYSDMAEKLAGKACCARYATSKFLGNPDYLNELGLILKRHRYDIIHINNGLHGLDYTEKQYEKSLETLICFLHEHAPQAKIIWAMTTPVRQGETLQQFHLELNPRVIERNRIAETLIKKYQIPVDDLYSLVKDHPEYYAKDGVHYNPSGRTVQAEQAAGIIAEFVSCQQ